MENQYNIITLFPSAKIWEISLFKIGFLLGFFHLFVCISSLLLFLFRISHNIRCFRKLNRDTPLRTLAGLTGSWCQKRRERLIDLISSGIEPRVVVGPMDLQT